MSLKYFYCHLLCVDLLLATKAIMIQMIRMITLFIYLPLKTDFTKCFNKQVKSRKPRKTILQNKQSTAEDTKKENKKAGQKI